jgi:hypothetical protein
MAAAAPPIIAILGRATNNREMLTATLTKQLMAIARSNSLRFCEVLRFCAATSFLLSAVVFWLCLCLDFLALRLVFNI